MLLQLISLALPLIMDLELFLSLQHSQRYIQHAWCKQFTYICAPFAQFAFVGNLFFFVLIYFVSNNVKKKIYHKGANKPPL